MLRVALQALTAMSIAMLSQTAGAQEYFGEFLDKLRGTFNHQRQPRPSFTIENEFRFKDPNGMMWHAPAGAEVDGASIPQVFWSIIGGPFEGAYINASVIHDHYCRSKERTAHDTHRNFYYGMRALDVPEWKATLMHWAVETFGPSWKLEKRVVFEQACSASVAGVTTCASVPRAQTLLVTAPLVDLSDPVVLAAAIAKTNAVARTLRTSNGKILDVTAAGQVKSTPQSIQASAEAYRKVFASKEFSTSPAKLGLLSQPSGGSLAEIKPWAGSKIPTLESAVVLTPKSIGKVNASLPYKLDPRSKNLMADRVDLKTLEATGQFRNRLQ